MLIQEFTDMTGFEPTVEEFNQIEAEYYRFDCAGLQYEMINGELVKYEV